MLCKWNSRGYLNEIESIGLGASLATPAEATDTLLARLPRATTLQILELFNTL